ncbi:MAG: RloB family protein [Acidimicrobiaceae bacterium]|nr:RloB family protein [Acidimicrobiaceae bacterium]
MISRDRRHPRPLRRRPPKLDEKKRFVIFCEGKVTEPQYLNALARLPEVRKTTSLDIRGQGFDPKRLVKELRDFRKEDQPQRKAQEQTNTQYWCVFDVEAPIFHTRLNDAIQMARDNGIHLAVSNPCFELWLILHDIDHKRWLTNAESRKILRNYDDSEGKSLPTEAYIQRRQQAVTRARELDKMHDQAGRDLPYNNPSSGMFKLLDAVFQTSD